MKAVWYRRQGAPDEVLELGTLPTPAPGPGEVLVRLAASGVNPSDCNRRRGAGFAMEAPLVVPHSDGAGTIVGVGAGIDKARLGERVWLYNGQRNGRTMGTGAEFIALDATLVSALPGHVPFEAGACLGIPAMTAYACVFGGGPLDGRTVLVTGGAGAVGHYAIQLARWGGARVLTTVSNDEKAAHARRAGADVVVDYRRDDVVEAIGDATGGAGVDRVVDVDFGGNLAQTVKLVKANGEIAFYASRGEPAPALPTYELMRKCVTLRSVLLPALPVAVREGAQAGIGRWLREADAVHTVCEVFPLERTADAHRRVESGTKRGTVVVTP